MMSFSPAALAAALMLPSVVAQSTIVDVAVGTGVHNTLVTAVGQAGLADILSGEGPLTVFAPTDEAFGSVNPKYLEEQWASHLVDILTYHVTTGSVTSDMLTLGMPVNMVNMESARITSMTPPMINQATISGPDNVASNGVVHVVDSVLLPESATTSILQAASKTPELSTLADLIVAGGLNSALQEEGPFTVFAPTNEAFAALDAETLAHLTSPEGMDDLVNILTYHVFSGIVTGDGAASGTVPMLNGADVTVTVPSTMPELMEPAGNATAISRQSSGAIMINDAEVVVADILVSNGVIHVINKVLLPPIADEGAMDGGMTEGPHGNTPDDLIVGDGEGGFVELDPVTEEETDPNAPMSDTMPVPVDPMPDTMPVPVDPTPTDALPEGADGGLVPDDVIVGDGEGGFDEVSSLPENFVPADATQANGGAVTSINGVVQPGAAPAPAPAPMFAAGDTDDSKDDDSKDNGKGNGKGKDNDEDNDKESVDEIDVDEDEEEADLLSGNTGGGGNFDLTEAVGGAFIGSVSVTTTQGTTTVAASTTTNATTTSRVPAPSDENMGM